MKRAGRARPAPWLRPRPAWVEPVQGGAPLLGVADQAWLGLADPAGEAAREVDLGRPIWAGPGSSGGLVRVPGSSTKNSVPESGDDSTQQWPRWAWTISWMIASPSPLLPA